MTRKNARRRRTPRLWCQGWAALLLLAAPNLLASCKSQVDSGGERASGGERPTPEPQAFPAASSASKTSVHGSTISPGHDVSLAQVLANPREFEGKTVTVLGDVRRVCKKMGCWMELATDKSAEAPGCRVFFGAHQFFVPKDSDGSQARVQGEVQVKKVEAAFVEHLEQEGASFKAKNADGTADEVRLVATGVELTRS